VKQRAVVCCSVTHSFSEVGVCVAGTRVWRADSGTTLMNLRVMQCVAACYSVLQCFTVRCSVLQCAMSFNKLRDSVYSCNRIDILLQLTL